MFLLVYKAASASWLKYRTPKVVFLHGYCICLVLVPEAVLLLKDIFWERYHVTQFIQHGNTRPSMDGEILPSGGLLSPASFLDASYNECQNNGM